jgi:DNA polymerase-2
LVVSFGYLGYKNAVFRRIESHEATTPIGRQLITFVKEILEAKGFRVIHILTDSIWVYKHDYTIDDYKKIPRVRNSNINRIFKKIP